MNKRLKIFVSHINILIVTVVEGDWNNQVDTMTCSVDSQSLSPVIIELRSRLMKQMTMVAGMEVIHGLGHVDCCTATLTWL